MPEFGWQQPPADLSAAETLERCRELHRRVRALADAHWSAETGFYGDYMGPTTVRFSRLTVAGEGEQA